MMSYTDKLQQNVKKYFLPKTMAVVISMLLLQTVIGFIAFRYFSLREVRRELEDFTVRVEQGLKYRNGSWDTSHYTSDPTTPHPSGSSGFSTPLYIIGADGFVIERNAPINGLLDSADFNHLMAFQKPQTIKIISNEQWRILAHPVEDRGKTAGVIVVSFYNPGELIQTRVDDKLTENIEYIASKIKLHNGEIDTSAVDIREIDYDISFEIVSSFNKVLLNNGRMPTYIDKSYVYNELREKNKVRPYRDTTNQNIYLIVSHVLYDDSHQPVGVVVAGKSVQYIDRVMLSVLPLIGLTMLFSMLTTLYVLSRITRRTALTTEQQLNMLRNSKPLPKNLSFNKKTGTLRVDDHELEIPYASNQYYLCKAVFTDPKKRWEVDELLEAFGQDPVTEHWRKVYDAMILLNKKVEPYLSVKLIELRDKTYQLNPALRPLVTRTSQS